MRNSWMTSNLYPSLWIRNAAQALDIPPILSQNTLKLPSICMTSTWKTVQLLLKLAAEMLFELKRTDRT